MSKTKKVGRPKKENAVKSGELAKGLVRFIFIAQEKQILKIRQRAHSDGVSIKEMMATIIDHYFKKGTQPEKVRKVTQKNVNKLKASFGNWDTNQDSNSSSV